MDDATIIKAFGFIATLIAVLVPLFKLNGNIVRLTTVVEQLEELIKEKTDKLDERITKHGKEIDELAIKSTDHEARIKALEK